MRIQQEENRARCPLHAANSHQVSLRSTMYNTFVHQELTRHQLQVIVIFIARPHTTIAERHVGVIPSVRRYTPVLHQDSLTL